MGFSEDEKSGFMVFFAVFGLIMNISKMGRTSYTIESIVFIGRKWFVYQNLLQTKLHPFTKPKFMFNKVFWVF